MPKVELIAMESRREDTAHDCGPNSTISVTVDVRRCEHEHYLQGTEGHTSAAARSNQVCSNLGDDLVRSRRRIGCR